MTHATTDNELALERIDQVLAGYELCHDCGRHMTMNDRDGRLWFECSSLRSRSGLLLRIALRLHDRRLVEMPRATAA